MAKPWVRLYRDAILKPKVGRLSLGQLGFWSCCLMLSDDDGNLPEIKDIAWTLRMGDADAQSHMDILIGHGLVTRDVTVTSQPGSQYRLHDWDAHQQQSDGDPTARERKQRQREREKAQKSAVTVCHADVTRTDTDTDTEIETEKKLRVEHREEIRVAVNSEPTPIKKTVSAPKGSRWPSDAVVPDEWLVEGEAYREAANHPPIDLRAEALKFANYWAAKSGGSATKIDWKRTWLNWCLQARGNHQNGAGIGRKSQLEQLQEIIAGERSRAVIDG